MKLYFQAGKNKRVAIDTDKHIWNNNYWYLGGHRLYIKINVSDYNHLLEEIDFNGYDYEENFQ